MATNTDDTWRALLERLPIAAVISDLTTGELLWVNGRNMQTLAGVSSPRDLIGHSLLEFIEPAQQAIALRDVEAVSRGESPAPVVYHLRRLDGGAADAQIMSVPLPYREAVAMLSLVADLSERERVCRDLAESEDRYRQLVETSPDGIVVIVDDAIVYANPAVIRAIGLDAPDQMVGRSVYDFIEPRFHKDVREGRRAILLSRVSVPASPVTLVRVDGSHVETTAQSTFVRWKGEPATQTLLHDLTIGLQDA